MNISTNYNYEYGNVIFKESPTRNESSMFIMRIYSAISVYYDGYSINNFSSQGYVGEIFVRKDNIYGERPFIIVNLTVDHRDINAIGSNYEQEDFPQHRGLIIGVFSQPYSTQMKDSLAESGITFSEFRNRLYNYGFIGTSFTYDDSLILNSPRALKIDTTNNKFCLSNDGRGNRKVKMITDESDAMFGFSIHANDEGVSIFFHNCLSSGNRPDKQRFGKRFSFVNMANSEFKSSFMVFHQFSDDNKNLNDYDLIINKQVFSYIDDGTNSCASTLQKGQSNLCTLNYSSSIWDNIPYENELPESENGNILSIPLYMVYNTSSGMMRKRIDSDLFKLAIAKFGTSTNLIEKFKLGKVSVKYINSDSSWKWHGGIVISK